MREKHTLWIWMACRHAEPGSLNMCVECCAAERQAAADEARAEERKWVREQVAELKKVSGWKCELIERMDAREASDE